MNRVSTSIVALSPAVSGDVEFGEHPGDLGAFLRGERPGGAGDADEVGADLAHVGPQSQRAARAGLDVGARCDGGHGVTERHHHGVGVGTHEQPVAAGVDTARWVGREHQPAVGRQGGHRGARDRDVQRPGRSRYQGRGDVADRPVGAAALRPGDGRGGLVDRQQRGQPAQHQPEEPRDERDDTGRRCRHEARWYAKNLMTQRRRAPQAASRRGSQVQTGGFGVGVVRHQPL